MVLWKLFNLEPLMVVARIVKRNQTVMNSHETWS